MMHIPDKYRDRYDRLAASHPWMREMRDEPTKGIDPKVIPEIIKRHFGNVAVIDDGGEAVEWRDDWTCNVGFDFKAIAEEINALLPTNGIDGETNGIGDEITLPEGDAVSILRRAADSDTPMVSLCDRFDAAPLLPSEHSRVFGQLADMVERDYVPRYMHDLVNGAVDDKVRLIIAERDELKRKLEIADRHEFESDQACDECKEHTDEHLAEIIAERDEWKAKAEQAMESYADAKDARDTWMAKYKDAERAMNKAAGKWARADAELREGSSKVRVGQSNLEWLLEHDRKAVADFLDCAVNMCNNCAYDKYRIDDKCPSGSEWLMAPHKDAHSKAHSKTEPSLSEQSESLSDENTPETPVFVENPRKTPEKGREDDAIIDEPDTIRNELEDNGYVVMPCHNGERQAKLIGKQFDQLIYDELHDSREKLEADVQSTANAIYLMAYDDGVAQSGRDAEPVRVGTQWITELLDRKAAIVERDVRERMSAMLADSFSLKDKCIAKLQERIAELQSKLEDAEFERDELREKLEDDWKYVSLKKQVDALRAKAQELTAAVDKSAADLKACRGQLKTERNNFEQVQGARDYWRDKLSLVLHRLRELGCEVGGINDVPITVELPREDGGLA